MPKERCCGSICCDSSWYDHSGALTREVCNQFGKQSVCVDIAPPSQCKTATIITRNANKFTRRLCLSLGCNEGIVQRSL